MAEKAKIPAESWASQVPRKAYSSGRLLVLILTEVVVRSEEVGVDWDRSVAGVSDILFYIFF